MWIFGNAVDAERCAKFSPDSWTAFHEPIRARVSSYRVSAGVVIDPKVPDDGFGALPGMLQQIVLTRGQREFVTSPVGHDDFGHTL